MATAHRNMLGGLICLGLICQLSAAAAVRAEDALPAPLAAMAERLGCDRNVGAHAFGVVPGRPAEQSAVLYCATPGEPPSYREMLRRETIPDRVIIVGMGADGEARMLDSFAPLQPFFGRLYGEINVEVTSDPETVSALWHFGYVHAFAQSVAEPLRKQLPEHSNVITLRGYHYMATAQGRWLAHSIYLPEQNGLPDAGAMPQPLADLAAELQCRNPRPPFAFGVLPDMPAERSAVFYCLSGRAITHTGWWRTGQPRDGDIVIASMDDKGRAQVLDRMVRTAGSTSEANVYIFEPRPLKIVTEPWVVDATRRLGHEHAPASKALSRALSNHTNVISVAGEHYMATREGKWLERGANVHGWLAESAVAIDSVLPDDLAALARQLACMHFDGDALQDDFVAYSDGILPGDERASAVFYCRKWIKWRSGMELVVVARDPDGRATLLDIVYLDLDEQAPLPAIGIDARADADAIARSGQALMPISQKLQGRLQGAASNVVTMGSLCYVIAGGRWHRCRQ